MADTSNESALVLATRLSHELNAILSALDIDLIGKETAKDIDAIRRLTADARLDIRDHELADSRADMEKYARAATKRLDALRVQILKASEHGIFGAIDVAQLSTQLDAIVADLE